LAAEEPKDGQKFEGYVVQKDFSDPILLTPIDLETFTNLSNTEIKQKQIVPFNLSFQSLKAALSGVYENVDMEEEEDDGVSKRHLVVHREIRISQTDGENQVVMIEWDSSIVNDMLADSILAIITQMQSTPKENERHKCCHRTKLTKIKTEKDDTEMKGVSNGVDGIEVDERKRRDMILSLLRPQFEEVKWDEENPFMLVAIANKKEARLMTSEVDNVDNIQWGGREEGELQIEEKERVEKVHGVPDYNLIERLQRAYLRARLAVYPLS